MVMQGRASEEHRIANNQVDLLAKQGAASGGPPQALIEAYRRERKQPEDIRRWQPKSSKNEATSRTSHRRRSKTWGVTDEKRDVQKPVFFQAMERRALPSGAWVDVKPKMTIDAELSLENKNELISARVRNKTAAGGELVEFVWYWEQTLNRQRWVPGFPAAFQAYWSETQIKKCEDEEMNFESTS